MDTWLAELSDGSCYGLHDEYLGAYHQSPWRELEERARTSGLDIVLAAACLGRVAVALDAEGHPLRCGQTLITTVGLDGGEKRETQVRWVRREEPQRWLWRATDGQTAWEVVTPPGEPLHRYLSV